MVNSVFYNTKSLVQFILKNFHSQVNIAVDMTAGNGHDSKFIMEIFNPEKLYAFDIQEQAKENTISLLEEAGFSVNFVLDSHANIKKHVSEKIDLAIYNLGYLPSGDHSITTEHDTVRKSLEDLLDLLNDKGLVLITFYPGHDEGKKEALELNKYLESLDQKTFTVVKFNFINQINNPPFTIMIQKK